MSTKTQKILLLGGTKEAANLAEKLAKDGHDLISSLAGRTKEPKPIAGKIRVGGFGGATGLANFIREEKIELLIDATHPFAIQISQNAKTATMETGVSFQQIMRPLWQKETGDNWFEVESLELACHAICQNSKVLLALGSQHLAAFYRRDDVHFVVRMIDKPAEPLPFKQCTLITGKPSLEWKDEKELLQKEAIDQIICRNSGGQGAYAKIIAARKLNIPVILIGRNT